MPCTSYVYNTSDSHLPQLRQLFEDPRRLEHSELIVVQTPRNRREEGGQRQRQRTTEETEELKRGFLYTAHVDTLCSNPIQRDSQFCSVLRDVIWYFGEFLVGAVDRGALTTALLGAGQVGEAVPS